MTAGGNAPDHISSAILRAVGSLLVALGGSDEAAVQRIARAATVEGELPAPEPDAPPAAGRTSEAGPAPRDARNERREPVPNPDDTDAEVEFILADAREQAQRLLDESMERARALIEERHATPATEQSVREVSRAVSDLTFEVKSIQERLDRIEALIRDGRAIPTAAVPAPAPAPAPVAPSAFAPPAQAAPPPPVEPVPAPPPVQEPPAAMPPAAAAEPDPSTRPAPAMSPPRSSSFAVVPPPPPVPGAAGAPPRSAVPPLRTPQPAPAAEERVAPPAAALPDDDDEPAPLVTFLPGEGMLILRVKPVSGFQGLMRVQDALARLPAVRHAAVEAYSQGEARLRIELQEPTDSDEIANGLSDRLQEPVTVRSASEADRELLIALR